MSELNIRLDMNTVQSTVQAKVRPAVEEALGKIDVQKIIVGMLLEKPKKSKETSYDVYSMMFMGGHVSDSSTLIEKLVDESIREIAKQFVEKEMRGQKQAIEDGFRKMMMTSSNKLVKAFASALQRGLEADWDFKLKVGVELAKPEKEREYSDE